MPVIVLSARSREGDKVAALEQYGIEVTERVPHAFPSNDHNAFYLSTKKEKSGHLL